MELFIMIEFLLEKQEIFVILGNSFKDQRVPDILAYLFTSTFIMELDNINILCKTIKNYKLFFQFD